MERKEQEKLRIVKYIMDRIGQIGESVRLDDIIEIARDAENLIDRGDL